MHQSSPPQAAPPSLDPPAQPRAAGPIPSPRAALRLLAEPEQLELLQTAPIIVQHARNRGIVRHIETIYYDTGDRALLASGLSLRVQKQGRRFVQRLRQNAPGAPPVAWESPLDDAAPDLSGLPISAALLERLASTPLTVMFETRLRRLLRRLELPGASVDIAFDEGALETASRREPLCEIRLALQAGEDTMLYEIAMRLLELAPLQINAASIVRRGYALAAGTRLKAEKAAPSAVSRSDVVDDMVAAILTGCQHHLQANQAVAIEGASADGVHQMRVALRRMRSAFTLLRREMPSASMQALAAEAKWLAGELEAARGWDVFLATTLTEPARLAQARLAQARLVQAGGGISADFGALREAAEAPRRDGYARARSAIASARHTRFALSLSQWIARRGWRNKVDRVGLGVLAEPASTMASRVLIRLHRKAMRQGRHFKRLSAEQRHELRITLKKLRYATEFFLPLVLDADGTQRFMRRLSVLQDALGLDHDAATTQPLLEEVARSSLAPGLHQAIGMVAGWQGRDATAAHGSLVKRWRRFKATPPCWPEAAAKSPVTAATRPAAAE